MNLVYVETSNEVGMILSFCGKLIRILSLTPQSPLSFVWKSFVFVLESFVVLCWMIIVVFRLHP